MDVGDVDAKAEAIDIPIGCELSEEQVRVVFDCGCMGLLMRFCGF